MSVIDRPLGKQSAIKAFVHIPKTAGSTINDLLQRSQLKGQDHIEQWLSKKALGAEHLKELDWVSGHVPFPTMRALLSEMTPRHIRFFATYRNPVNQICSHYNWLIEIFHRGEVFYFDHPESIRAISEEIRATSNNLPIEVVNNLINFSDLFLNQQSRILIGEDSVNLSADEIVDRLQVYDFIALEGQLDELLELIIGAPIVSLPHENKSRYHFDPLVFNHPIVQNFLSDKHQTDIQIYNLLSGGVDRITEESALPNVTFRQEGKWEQLCKRLIAIRR